jgi:hypothetical protein
MHGEVTPNTFACPDFAWCGGGSTVRIERFAAETAGLDVRVHSSQQVPQDNW